MATGAVGERCTGVIMAGGTASRMGGERKGLTLVRGRRIIDRVADALRATSDELLIIANDDEAATWLPDVRAAHDLRRHQGALGGLHAALHHAESAVLVVAWDMPWVPAPLLAHLRSLGATTDAVVPWSPGPRGVEPLCAWYSARCLPVIERRLDAGQREMVGLLNELRTVIVPPEDVRAFGEPSRMFFNVNTPDDLQRTSLM